jgi:hypothetical protein
MSVVLSEMFPYLRGHVREHTQYVCFHKSIAFPDFIVRTLSRKFYEASAVETRKRPNICSRNK